MKSELRRFGKTVLFFSGPKLLAYGVWTTKYAHPEHAAAMSESSLGDTAAHHRVYITRQGDIDHIKQKYRRLLQELLSLSGINR